MRPRVELQRFVIARQRARRERQLRILYACIAIAIQIASFSAILYFGLWAARSCG